MSYRLAVLPRAEKALRKLPVEHRKRLAAAIDALEEEPRPSGCKKLRSREGWRIRVGTYRAIYEIDDDARTVTVLDVRHRKDAYR